MLEGIVGDTPCWSRSSYLKSESRQFRVTTITSHKQRELDLKTAEEKRSLQAFSVLDHQDSAPGSLLSNTLCHWHAELAPLVLTSLLAHIHRVELLTSGVHLQTQSYFYGSMIQTELYTVHLRMILYTISWGNEMCEPIFFWMFLWGCFWRTRFHFAMWLGCLDLTIPLPSFLSLAHQWVNIHVVSCPFQYVNLTQKTLTKR